MRTFSKPDYDWYMDMQQLQEITLEVYGIEYDIQMGERSNGEHQVVSTDGDYERQGYSTGLGTGYGYDGKYIEGHGYHYFDESPEAGSMASQAMAKWVAQAGKPETNNRPFDKVGENGQYEYYQPEIGVVMEDLAKRCEIPKGTYFISIDW